MKGKKSDIPLETRQSMLIHLSPIRLQLFVFFFCVFAHDHSSAVQFFTRRWRLMLSPLRDEFLLRFLFREDIFHFSLTSCCFFFVSGMFHEKRLPFQYFSQGGFGMKFVLLMSLRGGEGPPKSLRDRQGAPCSQHLKQNETKKNPHHFCKATVLSVLTRSPSHGIHFGFKTVSSGSSNKRRREREEKKKTLFVRKNQIFLCNTKSVVFGL